LKYIASCSFGKDSIASIILAHIHNEPLDLIVYSEVMFDEDISGENPLHRDFIYNIAIPTFEKWGYQVKVLRSKKMNYLKSFYTIVKKAKTVERNGKLRGFLVPFGCVMNSNCKVQPIKDFYKTQNMNEVTQYIGIALDEPKRLERLKGNKISLLEKYKYTEKMASKLCEEYGLLSPIYAHFPRGGCWFCPNARDKELMFIKTQQPFLWKRLLDLPTDNLANARFSRTETIHQIDNRLNKKLNSEKDQLKLFEVI
jgi:3'-phosphoadenosine 5'-phosphosulfate sulfotransferase (PAPS reductase)/FAD synthetase